MEKNNADKVNLQEARDRFVGAEVDAADDNNVTAKMVKDDTCMLNNNPRNEAINDD